MMAAPGELITEGMIINNGSFEMEIDRRSNSLTTSTLTLDENTPLRSDSLQFRNEFFDSHNDDSQDLCYESTSLTIFDSLTSTFQNQSYGSTSSGSCCSSANTKIYKTPSTPPVRRGSSSYLLRSSILTTFAEEVCTERNSTVLSTIFNLLPLLQGTPIFVLPFAIIIGGFCFIPAAVVLCIIADTSSNLLAECLYTYPSLDQYKRRIHKGLHDIANSCLGKFWGNAMYSVVIFYLVANNIINIIIFDKSFRILVANVISMNTLGTMFIYSVIFTSILFVRKIPVFVFNMFVGTVTLVVAIFTAISIFLASAETWHTNYRRIPLVNVRGFALAIGMFMYSLMVNPIIAEIEGGMINPQKFGTALHVSYGISSTFKLLFGLMGALTYALNTKELIAMNIVVSNNVGKYFIAISLLLCTFSNCSLPYYVLFDKFDQLMENSFSSNFGENGRFYVFWLVVTRAGGVMCTVFIALKLPYYAAVVAVVGSIAGAVLILIFPFLFHLKLHWKHLSSARKTFEIILLLLGVAIGFVCTYQSFSFLLEEAFGV